MSQLATTGRFRWLRSLVTVSALVMAATVTFGAAPAHAAWAKRLGDHSICADSVALYDNGRIGTLYRGDTFRITRFGNNSHVWGWEILEPQNALLRYGWVYNGWFC